MHLLNQKWLYNLHIFFDIRFAAIPTRAENITSPTIFKLTIASTGFDGINARSVLTIFLPL